MALLQVKDYVNDVYVLMGNLTRDQLPIEIVLRLLYNELDKRRIQLNLTENNQFLISKEKTIVDPRDQLVSINDFGSAVAVHLINPFNQSESPVEIVNFNTLPAYETDGQLRVSLYGNPLRIRYSLDLTPQIGWSFKFWYEPDTVSRGINANVNINQTFRSLVTLSVAMASLPHAEIPEEKKAQLALSFASQLGNQNENGSLENLWYIDIAFQGQYGNNYRRPFRAGQARYSRFRR
jgi:hypothetical protein